MSEIITLLQVAGLPIIAILLSIITALFGYWRGRYRRKSEQITSVADMLDRVLIDLTASYDEICKLTREVGAQKIENEQLSRRIEDLTREIERLRNQLNINN